MGWSKGLFPFMARIAVSNTHAMSALPARRDVHHGNGIQDILWEEDIAYISLHRCKK